VNWDIFDFAVFGAMLLGVGVVYALAKRRASNTTYRFAIGVALAAAFLLVWVNGAVGIIGNENNDANMMFFGVLLVGVVGAIIARLRPKGMARAMYATAFAQVMVAVIALTTNLGTAGASWPWDVLVLTGFFTALWIVSARLFRKAARHPLSDPEFK
jgi:di/tricarboxylate transporter